jgi:hypothetical protein
VSDERDTVEAMTDAKIDAELSYLGRTPCDADREIYARGHTIGHTKGFAAGVAAERERCAQIFEDFAHQVRCAT